GVAAFAMNSKSEFDGFDPITFVHTDTLDNTHNHMEAGRIWAQLGGPSQSWSGRIGMSLLGSSNRNFLADDFLNRTSGSRRTLDVQAERRFTTGTITHTLIAAADAERESFHARDTIYGGFTDQDRTRDHESVTLEWRGESRRFTGDLAVRRDTFSRFQD